MKCSTFPLPDGELDDIDVLDLGARSGMVWASADVVLAGLGVAVRIPIDRPTGGLDAQRALGKLEGVDGVKLPGSGPVAFAAMAFDREAPGELLVPEIVVGQSNGQRWLSIVGDGSFDIACSRVLDVARRPVPAGPHPTSFELTSVLSPEQWRDDVVAAVRDRIVAGELDKAVLARELRLVTDQPIDTALVIDRLRRSYSSANLFCIDGFLGASPEMLVARFDDTVRAHPLAGTAPRGTDPAVDDRLAADLLASTKDQKEHRITIDWLLDSLLPFCSYVDAEPEPSIVTLANVHHLGTRVEGRLSSPAASVLELVETLHPTPAVGGDPQKVALDLIDEVEMADRGRYAGPVGWVDSRGNGEFAVGIRSAEVAADGRTRLFAGVGVVADSDPESELAETRSKFQAMLGALVRP
ncbi:MAG: isochorismate synthase [Acidimicrobiales bacterium]